jgi:hypothetical protein
MLVSTTKQAETYIWKNPFTPNLQRLIAAANVSPSQACFALTNVRDLH